MGKRALFLLLTFGFTTQVYVFGQTDTSTTMSIDIKSDYEPKVSAANKIITKPDIQPIKSEKPSFTYDLPILPIRYCLPIEPLKLSELSLNVMSHCLAITLNWGVAITLHLTPS